MYKIEQKFRSTYTGEDVTTYLEFRDARQQEPTTEWVPNSVFNNRLTTQAIVIGGGETAKKFPLSKIQNHRGGILGSAKLQTYGTNDMFKHIKCDFLFAVGKENIDEIALSGYCNDNVVYSTAQGVLSHPGKMYLTPQNPPWNAGAIAAYMAAFDGHTKVFLLGFETEDKERPFWVKAAKEVFTTYPETDFVYISQYGVGAFPQEWAALDNVRHISVRDFILEADIG